MIKIIQFNPNNEKGLCHSYSSIRIFHAKPTAETADTVVEITECG